MRDILLTLFIAGCLPFLFSRPFYGLVMFTWLAYMRAPDLCWGFAKTTRFSLYVALLMFIGFFLTQRKKFYIPELRNNLLFLLTILVLLSVLINYFMTDLALGKYDEFVKIILIAIFTVTIVDEQWKLRVMIWTVALSLGFYGVKCGIFGVLGGEVLQGPGGLLLDNNDFSLAMVMNVPFLFYLSVEEKDKRVRQFLRFVLLLTVVTVVATRSRGGFLALTTVYFVITLKSNHKMMGFSLAIVAALLFVIFIPAEYVDRLKTITDVKEQSAANRLVAWETALNMIKDRPVFGVGLGNFVANYYYYCPIKEPGPDGVFRAHVAHNSYLQIWAECGTIAFMVFMALIAVTLVKLRALRKRNLTRGGPTWITNYTNIFEVSIYGYLVGATFLNRAMFDLVYQIVGLTAAMTFIAVTARSSETAEEGPPRLRIRSRDGYLLPPRVNRSGWRGSPMKILYHHRIKSRDGQYIHIRALIDALRRQGHEVDEVGLTAGEAETLKEESRFWEGFARVIPDWLLEILRYVYSLPGALWLWARILRNRPDLIYERYALGNFAGVLAARWSGVPLFLEVNSPLAREMDATGDLRFPGLAQWAEDRILDAATLVLVVSHVLERIYVERGHDPEHIEVTPNGIIPSQWAAGDGAGIRERYGLGDAVVVGFVGFYRQWHRLDRILNLMSGALEDLEFKLLLVGDGPVRGELEADVARMGLADRVVFTGVVDHGEVPDHLAAFDVALQPEVTAYASPLKLFEYMAAGKAVVAPRRENITAIVKDGGACLLFDPESDDELGRALRRLVEDGDLRTRLGEEARRTVLDGGYTWDGNAERVLELFERSR